MARYVIGNSLRGYFTFHVANDRDAWALGCAIFNRHFPTQYREDGRLVYLAREESGVACMPRAREDWGDKLGLSRMVEILVGVSTEPWPYDGDSAPG